MESAGKKRKTEENGVGDGFNPALTQADVRKIIEPFTQEQLLDILESAAQRHLDVLELVRVIADRDPAQRKLFIRGLGWDTTTEGLRTIFSAYGELEEAIVIIDKATGKSKGYGFITFKHIDGAMLALKEPSKKIDGRMTVTQLASAGVPNNANPAAAAPGAVDVSARKIFVGNVPFDMAADRLLAHFLSYGEIEEGPLGFDKQTGKFRGFALFVYKTAEAARAAIVDPIKMIDGHQMNCKLANDNKKKPGVPGAQTGVPPQQLDGAGAPQSAMAPNPLSSQYGVPGGLSLPGGLSAYPYPSANQGPAGMAHHQLASNLQSSIGATGLSAGAGQVPSSLGGSGGYGAPYGGPASAYAGLGPSSLYRLPPGSAGLTSSGYPDPSHYGLSSSAFPGSLHQVSASSPVPRVPPGGLYPTMPPYY